MMQIDLPLSRNTDPTSSRHAEVKVEAFKKNHEGVILNALTAGGLTKDELAVVTGLDATAVARRMSAMERADRVARRKIGETPDGRPIYQTRLNKRGNPCAIWYRCW